MPMNLADYPDNWFSFSLYVRFSRARKTCECYGLCGRHSSPCGRRHGAKIRGGKAKVVLTTAHLNGPGGPCRCMPLCADPTHVKAMCQRCHLAYDAWRRKRPTNTNQRSGRACRASKPASSVRAGRVAPGGAE